MGNIELAHHWFMGLPWNSNGHSLHQMVRIVASIPRSSNKVYPFDITILQKCGLHHQLILDFIANGFMINHFIIILLMISGTYR
ncbi:hypothetical protein CEXT_547551 [Caerostris extrusa]|uniref:Uncharacterized protein n=1 Tax=Caerostris extrusa TaxID=172846 RepID=A0AAV4XIQ7_CAEEX|nr:hypothetical protein CEXT_547551 [Caerostris extrusa]